MKIHAYAMPPKLADIQLQQKQVAERHARCVKQSALGRNIVRATTVMALLFALFALVSAIFGAASTAMGWFIMTVGSIGIAAIYWRHGKAVALLHHNVAIETRRWAFADDDRKREVDINCAADPICSIYLSMVTGQKRSLVNAEIDVLNEAAAKTRAAKEFGDAIVVPESLRR